MSPATYDGGRLLLPWPQPRVTVQNARAVLTAVEDAVVKDCRAAMTRGESAVSVATLLRTRYRAVAECAAAVEVVTDEWRDVTSDPVALVKNASPWDGVAVLAVAPDEGEMPHTPLASYTGLPGQRPRRRRPT